MIEALILKAGGAGPVRCGGNGGISPFSSAVFFFLSALVFSTLGADVRRMSCRTIFSVLGGLAGLLFRTFSPFSLGVSSAPVDQVPGSVLPVVDREPFRCSIQKPDVGQSINESSPLAAPFGSPGDRCIGYAGEEDQNRLWRFIGKEKGAGL